MKTMEEQKTEVLGDSKSAESSVDEPDVQALLEAAIAARRGAYSPYSHFQVGAALLSMDGRIFTGCNIENAAYTPSNCAERTAFFKAVSEGVREFRAIAIVGGAAGTDESALPLCPPCGVCRQVMMEFCDPETFRIILGESTEKHTDYLLKDLMPQGFGPGNLTKIRES